MGGAEIGSGDGVTDWQRRRLAEQWVAFDEGVCPVCWRASGRWIFYPGHPLADGPASVDGECYRCSSNRRLRHALASTGPFSTLVGHDVDITFAQAFRTEWRYWVAIAQARRWRIRRVRSDAAPVRGLTYTVIDEVHTWPEGVAEGLAPVDDDRQWSEQMEPVSARHAWYASTWWAARAGLAIIATPSQGIPIIDRHGYEPDQPDPARAEGNGRVAAEGRWAPGGWISGHCDPGGQEGPFAHRFDEPDDLDGLRHSGLSADEARWDPTQSVDAGLPPAAGVDAAPSGTSDAVRPDTAGQAVPPVAAPQRDDTEPAEGSAAVADAGTGVVPEDRPPVYIGIDFSALDDAVWLRPWAPTDGV